MDFRKEHRRMRRLRGKWRRYVSKQAIKSKRLAFCLGHVSESVDAKGCATVEAYEWPYDFGPTHPVPKELKLHFTRFLDVKHVGEIIAIYAWREWYANGQTVIRRMAVSRLKPYDIG